MIKYLVTKTIVDIIENFTKIIILNSVILLFWGIALVFIKSSTIDIITIIIASYSLTILAEGFAALIIQGRGILDSLKQSALFSVLKIVVLCIGMVILNAVKENDGIFYYSLFWFVVWIGIVILGVASIALFERKSIKKILQISVLDLKAIAILVIVKGVLYLTNPFLILGAGASVVLEKNLYAILSLKYEYIKTNGSEKIEWNIVLKNEIEKLERKNILDLLFPWKGNGKN